MIKENLPEQTSQEITEYNRLRRKDLFILGSMIFGLGSIYLSQQVGSINPEFSVNLVKASVAAEALLGIDHIATSYRAFVGKRKIESLLRDRLKILAQDFNIFLDGLGEGKSAQLRELVSEAAQIRDGAGAVQREDVVVDDIFANFE